MYRTDDPIADFNRYQDELENALHGLPECSRCGEKIQDDFCYEINDEVICESCMDEFRKYTTDLMG